MSSVNILPNISFCVLQKKEFTGFGATWGWINDDRIFISYTVRGEQAGCRKDSNRKKGQLRRRVCVCVCVCVCVEDGRLPLLCAVDVLALFGVRDSLVVYPAGQRAATPQHCSANTPPATVRNSSAHICSRLTHTHTHALYHKICLIQTLSV